MPAIYPAESPLFPRSTHAKYLMDRQTSWVLLAVALILLIELALAVAFIFYFHAQRTSYWEQKRKDGIVIVSGPALIWVGDLPARHHISYINLRKAAEASRMTLPRHRV